jgi:hypothetical protein
MCNVQSYSFQNKVEDLQNPKMVSCVRRSQSKSSASNCCSCDCYRKYLSSGCVTDYICDICLFECLKVQSGIEDDIRPDVKSQTETQVNVTFDDEDTVDTVLTPVVKSIYTPTVSRDADLNSFLSRPVLIHSTNWELGSSIDTSFKPWHLFFDHTSIKKKIDNYAFIRCDLHVKVVVNASPFYYGALMYAYKPLNNLYNSAQMITGSDKLVGYSQRPKIIAYPQSGEGGEMILPFLYPREWLKLTSSSDLQAMGIFHLDSFSTLKSANGIAGTSIDIQMYAWAENVVLSGLTVGLAVQSDEYGKGVVSKPASAIARATGMLNNLPVVGPFMTATSIAAGAVSNIASLFGYTKVPVISDVEPFKNLPFHGLATAGISDCTERLCIDEKNELTINNMCIGDNCDDNLNVSTFVQRPSYLTQFTWQASDSKNTLLWNTYVTPFLSNITSGTGQTLVNGTPMWLVANLFDYWRGDIFFDLKIICSKYHRGRLRVSWDPIGDIANTTDSSTEVYTSIIDISEVTNVTMRVPYCQRTAYQKIPSALTTPMYDTTALAADTSDTVNGILTIRVLNEQTSPVAAADIDILVTVRGAENLEFASPKEIPSDLYYYTVQSGTVKDLQEITFGGSSSTDSNINLVYIGEQVVNLRSLLMRCNQTLVESEAAPPSQSEYQYAIMNRRPLFKGYDPNGIHTADEQVDVATAPYNFVNNTPYHMISQCFVGERGSFTWKVDHDSHEPTSWMISRPKTVLNASNYKFVATNLNGLSGNQQAAHFSQNDKTNSGPLLINQRTNTGISFNAPQYSILSFIDTSPNTRTEGLSNVTGDDAIRYTYIAKEVSKHDEVDYEFIRYMFQVGPDYSPVFFLNVPTMFIYDSTPVGS